MRAAIFLEKNKIKIEEKDIRKPNSDEVLIKVMACGVCGTDMKIFSGGKGAGNTPTPIILGHEFSGIIEEVGKNVAGYNIGDRVGVDPNEPCGQCYYCRGGYAHFCENMIGIGTGIDGGFAEYCVVSQKQLYILADNTTFLQGAMAEPLACCLHGIDMCNITAGETTAIIGGGMIGMLMLQLAIISGSQKTIMIEPVKEKREMAKMFGASLCIDPFTEDVKKILKENNINRISTVIECVGRVSTIEQAISIAGKSSIVMMFGLTGPDETIKIRPYDIFKNEIVLKSSYINPYTMERAMDLINSKKIDVESLIYKTIPLGELENFLLDSEKQKLGKFVVIP